MTVTLTRVLKPGMYGKDVEAMRIVGHNLLGQAPPTAALKIQRKFNGSMSVLVKAMQDDLGVPKNGWVGPVTMRELNDADKACGGCLFKPKVKNLLDEYADAQKPKLIEPNQGFDSLDWSLWEAYSIGRRRGLRDVGTYNPRSTLPESGRASDHATGRRDGRIGQPVVAFDLGFSPQSGQRNPDAKWVFDQMVGRPEVNYVILGDKIWSDDRGLHYYSHGGHDGHVHVSGHRR